MININKIKQLISEGKTAEAISFLKSINFEDNSKEVELIALSSRFKRFEYEKHGNLTDPGDLERELNKINAALLHFINELSDSEKTKQKNSIRFAWGIAAGTIGVLASIAGFSGYTLKDFKSTQRPLEKDSLIHQVPATKLTVPSNQIDKAKPKVITNQPQENVPVRQQQNTNSISVGRDNNGIIDQKNNQGDASTTITIPMPAKKDEKN